MEASIQRQERCVEDSPEQGVSQGELFNRASLANAGYSSFQEACKSYLEDENPRLLEHILSSKNARSELESEIAWSFPEPGVTFDLSFPYSAVDLSSLEEIGRAAANALFLDNSNLHNPKFRSIIGLESGKSAFEDQLIALVPELMELREKILDAAEPIGERLPAETLDLARIALGAAVSNSLQYLLCRVTLETVEERHPGALNRIFSREIASFGSIEAKLSPIIEWEMRKVARNSEHPFGPQDGESYASKLSEFVTTPREISRQSSRKIANVAAAQELADSFEELDASRILRINRTVLAGLDRRGGELRDYDTTPGSPGARPQCTAPLEIPAALEAWLERANALDADGAEHGKLQAVAMLCAGYQQIHPTADGNGRTGHVITNWCLRKAGLPPFSVAMEHSQAYIKALDAAIGRQEYAPLIELFSGRARLPGQNETA